MPQRQQAEGMAILLPLRATYGPWEKIPLTDEEMEQIAYVPAHEWMEEFRSKVQNAINSEPE